MPNTNTELSAAGVRTERSLLSVVTPVFNEAENLPIIYERFKTVLAMVDVDWEWIIVDDHSADDSFQMISDISKQDARIRGIRFARNFGAHTAITCGFHHARGSCCIAMAADLQDPPESIPDLIDEWRKDAQIVWAVRAPRKSEKKTTIFFSKIYYWRMRKIVGFEEMPSTGADFVLLDRIVVDAFNSFRESNVSILALINWMGFRHVSIHYDKKARAHGQSGWTLKKKLKLLVDSVTSFSYFPVRFMSYFGFLIATIGFVYAIFLVFNAINGHPAQGWTSLMVVVLMLGGIQLLMMGVLGEYLWRSLDESRRRPRYLIEAITDADTLENRPNDGEEFSAEDPTENSLELDQRG